MTMRINYALILLLCHVPNELTRQLRVIDLIGERA